MSILDQLYGPQDAPVSMPDASTPYDAGSGTVTSTGSGIDWTSVLNNGLPRMLDAFTGGNRLPVQNVRPVLPNSQNTMRYDPNTGAYVAGGGSLTILVLIGLIVFAMKD